MAGASGGALAAQVTLGGGFGFIGAGYDTTARVEQEIETARQALGIDRHSPLRIGVGYLCWCLEKDEPQGEKLVRVALDNRVTAIWLAFGSNLPKWIQLVRDYDATNSTKTLIFVQLSSVEDARVAIHDWKVDVIVAQGIEAGGHGAGDAPPLKSLIPSFVSETPSDGPVIVGAGGLVTGKHIAELLTLGAAGAALGTRFLMTPESLYSDAHKQALAAAKSTDSVRTMAFDQARGSLGWPSNVDGRGLRNATVDDYERGENIDVLRSKFQEAVRDGNMNRAIVWAGASVGLVTDVKPAKEITEELRQELVGHLKDSASSI